jgi:O-methyltransferase
LREKYKEIKWSIAMSRWLQFKHGIKCLLRTLTGTHNPNPDSHFEDVTAEEWNIIRQCREFTLTSPERLLAAIRSAEYLTRHGIEGDIVECGVWRGGSSMAIALSLIHHNDTSRNLYLYDTYDGMPPPSENDLDLHGQMASELLEKDPANFVCRASAEDVEKNMAATGYPQNKIHIVKGPVEKTIPANMPQNIAMLRLDTDWYESTLHEMQHLFPALATSGVIIIDDYGHWKGARKAVDEYLANTGTKLYLARIDYTGRVGVKQG